MTRLNKLLITLLWGLSALALLTSPSAIGQEITGSVTARVTDKSGASINNATVVLKNQRTGTANTGTTATSGTILFPLVQPGHYQMTVSAPGFATAHVGDITVSLGQHIKIPIQLSISSVKQSITVSAQSASLLNTQSASVGQTMPSKAIRDLPLDGRNFVQLLTLTTGVQSVNQGDSPANLWTGRANVSVSIAGLRESDVSYLVNGIETRNARFGNASLFISPDAIEQFRVQRTTFGAQFGHSASIVNIVIRGGTNTFHGDLFDLNRNGALAATDYFLKQSSEPKAPLNQNNFGATLAGPIIIPKLYDGRNKSFFMFNYEGFRQDKGELLEGRYPSRAQLHGDLADDSAGTGIYPLTSTFCQTHTGSQKCADVINPFTGAPFPGNVIPSSMLDPIDQKALPYIPTPNLPKNVGDPNFPAYNTIATRNIRNDWDQYNARLDHVFSPNDYVYATFSDETENLYHPSINPYGGNNYPLADHLWTLTWSHTFNPQIVNELRAGTNNSVTYLTPETAGGPNYSETVFGFKNTDPNPAVFGIPDFGISGFSAIGSFAESIGAQQKNYQLTDNVILTKGHHNLTAGIQVMHTKFVQATDFGGLASFTFDGRYTGTVTDGIGLGDFLLGTPYSASGAAGNPTQNLHTNYYAAYVQDNWQISHTFLLSYGLRYAFSRYPVEAHNHQAYFDLNTGKEVIAGQGIRRSIVKPDYRDLAPRIGFSWSPHMLPNTVIRGGGGIYYGTDNWNELQFSIVGSPFYQVQTLYSDPTHPTLSMENMLPPFSTSTNLDPFTLNPNNRTPYYGQYGLNIQHVFGKQYLVAVGYAGNIGKDLPQRYNANAATIDPSGTIPMVDRVPYPKFGFILMSSNEGASDYNALTAKLEKRFRHGLYFLGSFTYSKAIDQGITDDFSAISRDFRKYDRGVSDYDVPVQFSGSVIYDLPFGRGKMLFGRSPRAVDTLISNWQVNAITNFSRGQYATATLPTDWLNIGAFSQSRPNVNRSEARVGRKLPTQYFNPAAFTYPKTHIEGNAGRNTFEQPGIADWDISIFKRVPVHKRANLQIRASFFNAFNHPNFGFADMTVGPGFGQITSDSGPRVIQLGTRLQW